jgi:CRP-like cAMP-binding protein
MSSPNQSEVRNNLLQTLSPNIYASLLPHMEVIDLPLRHVLVEAGEPTSHVCFVERGLASVVATSVDEESVEVGHIGWEGMTGTHVILRDDMTVNKTFIQIAGSGIRVPVQRFNEVLRQDPASFDVLLRYVHAMEIQVAHSVLANARYNVHERLARWLLMCHDRVGEDHLPLTHEFLSLMLGVRRSGVTNELHILEGIHAIKSTRGDVKILDRSKLEEIAVGCYGVPEREYERLIGKPARQKQ